KHPDDGVTITPNHSGSHLWMDSRTWSMREPAGGDPYSPRLRWERRLRYEVLPAGRRRSQVGLGVSNQVAPVAPNPIKNPSESHRVKVNHSRSHSEFRVEGQGMGVVARSPSASNRIQPGPSVGPAASPQAAPSPTNSHQFFFFLKEHHNN